MTNCKIDALARRAAELLILVEHIDGEIAVAPTRDRPSLEQKLDPLMREMFQIEADALKFYAGSIGGAIFQLVAVRRTIEKVRTASLSDEQREVLCVKAEKAIGSVLRFIGAADKPTLEKLAAFDGAA